MWIRILLIILATASGTAVAQELDPRAYQPAPVGMNAITFSYTHSSGDIVFDPSFPAKDVQAGLHLQGLGYYRTFGLFGRFSNISASIPYAAGHLNGTLEGLPREIYRSGLGDARLRLVVNLKGTPALTPGEFVKRKPQTNIAYSTVISFPTGQYDSNKVINIGQNRWAVKQEVALIQPLGKWQVDLYGGAWLFSENDDFFGGRTQEQDAVMSFQFHLTRNFGRGYWFGFNSNFYRGGRTTVDGVKNPVEQRNSRVGGTVSLPLPKNQFLKVAVSRGAFITRGGNFTSIGVSYTYAWASK